MAKYPQPYLSADAPYAPIPYYLEQLARAENLGYTSYSAAILGEYYRLKSMDLTAAQFGITRTAVQRRLKRMGAVINPRGGSRNRGKQSQRKP